jgi:HlyD family secretion protein
MANLTTELASLRIDRNTSTRSVWRRAIFVGLIMAIAAVCGLYLVSGRLDRVEVETVRPSTLSSSAGAAATPILTATGYLVARRQAVVSAKIQGRLAQLNVDEGSHVLKEEVIARLDSADYQAQIDVARAQIVRAEADLAEQQRQLRLTRSLADAGVISQDQLEAALS